VENRIRVGVIFGGRSGEHEVSLVSARCVMEAMDRSKYETIPIGITKEGKWIASGDPLRVLEAGSSKLEELPTAILADRSERGLIQLESGQRGLTARRLRELDVIFPVLHGPYGEDGSVQGLLELADIPYVGAGVAASALGMDKDLMKKILQRDGLPVVGHLLIRRRDWEANPEEAIARIEARFGYPCFIKPTNLGSSVGITKAHHRQGLESGLQEAALYDRKLLVEEAVDAREIECSVLGNDNPTASVLGEIVPCNEFYDYSAKYLDDRSELIIPADLPSETTRYIQELATRTFQALDCSGMARVDFFLERGTGVVYINELNTIPGFTPISMYPKLWEASGLSYPELIDRLIELALERHWDKSRNRTSYDSTSHGRAEGQ
jgi:D-alanine-D-alanine ligase